MVSNVLLVDAGNSNVKSCLITSANTTQRFGDPMQGPEIFSQYAINKVLFISVRDKAYRERLIKFCSNNTIPFEEIKTSSSNFGTDCAYANYQTLGVDRWMMILAAAEFEERCLLVVSVGTAMTIDLVYDQQHIGGWIAPGFDLSKKALFVNTEHVFGNDNYPDNTEFGNSTENCVNFGCRALVNGLIREAIRCSKDYSSEVKILLCGGGAALVDRAEFETIAVDDNLIFKGMMRFI